MAPARRLGVQGGDHLVGVSSQQGQGVGRMTIPLPSADRISSSSAGRREAGLLVVEGVDIDRGLAHQVQESPFTDHVPAVRVDRGVGVIELDCPGDLGGWIAWMLDMI